MPAVNAVSATLSIVEEMDGVPSAGQKETRSWLRVPVHSSFSPATAEF